jgi:hypothetical protein
MADAVARLGELEPHAYRRSAERLERDVVGRRYEDVYVSVCAEAGSLG